MLNRSIDLNRKDKKDESIFKSRDIRKRIMYPILPVPFENNCNFRSVKISVLPVYKAHYLD